MSRQLARVLRLLPYSDAPAACRSSLDHQRAGVLCQTQCMRGQSMSPCQCLLRLVAPFSSDQSSSGVNAGASGIPKPVAVRHGIDQVPAHAVREAAADLRQAQQEAERNAQWPPQSEASGDVVLSASQSAAQPARQHSGADGSLGAAASSFKAGPLDQVCLQPQVSVAVDALLGSLAGLPPNTTCMCTASGEVPSSSARAAPDRPGGSSAEQSMQGDRARAQAAEAASQQFEASRAAEEEEEDQPAPRKQRGWLGKLLFGHGSGGNPAAQAALAAGQLRSGRQARRQPSQKGQGSEEPSKSRSAPSPAADRQPASEQKEGKLRKRFMRWPLSGLAEKALLKAGVDEDVSRFAGRTVSVVVMSLLASSALGTMGVDTKPIVAGLGITGITIGFALKDVAQNYISSVLLMVNKPFARGATVRVYNGSTIFEGEVMGIDLRYVQLKSKEGAVIKIPASIVFAAPVVVVRNSNNKVL